MKFYLALLVSTVMHIYAVLFFPFFGGTLPTSQNNDVQHYYFEISLKEHTNLHTLNSPLRGVPIENKNRQRENNLYGSDYQKFQSDTVHSQRSSKNQDLEKKLQGYYSTDQVDIKALPVSNLDISMFAGQEIFGRHINMRLYINTSGSVVKVQTMEGKDNKVAIKGMEDLLRALTFLPAKKNGIAVNSYQDVQLGFY